MPGRPPASKIIAQYRLQGSEHQWRDYVIPMNNVDDNSNNKRRRRRRFAPSAGTTIKPADLQGDNIDKLEFQVAAESKDGVRSDAIIPKFFFNGKFFPFLFISSCIIPSFSLIFFQVFPSKAGVKFYSKMIIAHA